MIMSFLISSGGTPAQGRAEGVLEPRKFKISPLKLQHTEQTRVCSGRALTFRKGIVLRWHPNPQFLQTACMGTRMKIQTVIHVKFRLLYT